MHGRKKHQILNTIYVNVTDCRIYRNGNSRATVADVKEYKRLLTLYSVAQ